MTLCPIALAVGCKKCLELPRFRGHMRAWVTSEFRLSQHWLRRSEGPDRSRACLSSCR
jgi:hypothetical protein